MARRGPSAIQWLLILALLLVAVLLVRVATVRDPSETESGDGLAPLPEEAVEEIVFTRGPDRIRVVLESDGFWIVEPYRDRADDRFLRSSLRVAATISPERVLPDTSGQPFGLDPPEATWRAAWDGGELQLAFGDTVPAGGGRYARPQGVRRIWILDPFLVRRFLAPPSREIHSPVPTPVGLGRVDSIRIVTREEEMLLARRPGGEWEILAPLRFAADARSVQRAVNDLRRETITDILGPLDSLDLEAIGLSPPRATWQLIQGGRRPRVRVGHPTPDQRSVHIIPSGRDVVALIPSESFRILVDGLDRLRDPRLFPYGADSVGSLVVEGSDRTRRFRPSSASGRWVEIAAEGEEEGPIRQDAFSTALANLLALQAAGYPDFPVSRRLRERLVLRIGLLDGHVDTLQLALWDEDTAIARASHQPGPVLLPAAAHRTWRLWLEDPLRP